MQTISELLDIPKCALSTVDGSESACDAAAQMSLLGQDTLLVLDGRARVIGIVTARHLLMGVTATEVDPRSVTVSELMTNALVKVAAEASLEEVCEVMRRCDSVQIVIVDCGEVFGFVLLEEVLLVLVNERAQRIRYLIDYITHG